MAWELIRNRNGRRNRMVAGAIEPYVPLARLAKDALPERELDPESCCFCGAPLERDAGGVMGHNPWPLSEADGERCCGDCNHDVIDARDAKG
jgi:hypothetical protein